MKIENIDTTLEEIQDLGDQMRQINEAIAQPVGTFADMDEDALADELAQLEQVRRGGAGLAWSARRCQGGGGRGAGSAQQCLAEELAAAPHGELPSPPPARRHRRAPPSNR